MASSVLHSSSNGRERHLRAILAAEGCRVFIQQAKCHPTSVQSETTAPGDVLYRF